MFEQTDRHKKSFEKRSFRRTRAIEEKTKIFYNGYVRSRQTKKPSAFTDSVNKEERKNGIMKTILPYVESIFQNPFQNSNHSFQQESPFHLLITLSYLCTSLFPIYYILVKHRADYKIILLYIHLSISIPEKSLFLQLYQKK